MLFVLARLLAAILTLAPSPAAEAQDEEVVRQMEIEGDVLYTAIDLGSDLMVKVYDISTDPGEPTELGGIFIPDVPLPEHMVVEDGLVYIHNVPDHTLVVVDARDPTNPVLVERGKHAFGVVVHDSFLFVDENNGDAMVVYEVNADGHPLFVTREPLPGAPTAPEPAATGETMEEDSLILDWPYVYFQTTDVFDVSDPSNPSYLGEPPGLAVAGNTPNWSVEDDVYYRATQCTYYAPCNLKLYYTRVWSGDNNAQVLDTGVDADLFYYGAELEMMGEYLAFTSGPNLFVADVRGFVDGAGSVELLQHEPFAVREMGYHAGTGTMVYYGWDDLSPSTLDMSFPETHLPLIFSQ